ncbi:MAG: PLP-dependent transferase [Gammaproteobacteria bacterium]|nr:PLP-dependent transferase [Gammaproteobacteria bacterium]
MTELHFDTQCIHGGQEACPLTGAVMPAIYTSSTFKQQSPGKHHGFEYSRTNNPTRQAYEKCMSELEQGRQAFAFSSGMAAINTIIDCLNPGDHVIAGQDLYGGTYRLFSKVKQGLSFTYVDTSTLQEIEKAYRPNTKMIWLETPSNPLLQLSPIESIAAWAKKHDVISVVDNTFASPWIQNPLSLGADIVTHSATKYLGGHSDVIGGIVIVNDEPALIERIAFLQNSCGAVPSPFDCYQVLRSLKTLSLRMERHCDNALNLANWLEYQPQVEKVIYPGLSTHPQHELAKQQMRHFGGMISLIIKGDLHSSIHFLEQCQLFTLAESLGGVESLIEHPASMTHASIPKEIREELGITDGLIRLSVGIEHIDDLKIDLLQAFKQAGL